MAKGQGEEAREEGEERGEMGQPAEGKTFTRFLGDERTPVSREAPVVVICRLGLRDL